MAPGRHMTVKLDRKPVVAGVDVGGTWIRVAVLGGARGARRIRLPASDVPDLRTLLPMAWGPFAGRKRIAALVVASRGIWTARERRAFARDLRPLAERVEVLSDAEAALLGALSGRPGVLLLSGTGSIAVGRDARDRLARAGGFGPLLGDEGSAFWLGREWLRATMRREDSMSVRALVRAPDSVRRIAALAPRVLRCANDGDRRARTIVRAAQHHLAGLVIDVARTLGLPRPVDVTWAGSLMENATFRRGIVRALAREGFSARWCSPEMEPVLAAAQRAQRLARQ